MLLGTIWQSAVLLCMDHKIVNTTSTITTNTLSNEADGRLSTSGKDL